MGQKELSGRMSSKPQWASVVRLIDLQVRLSLPLLRACISAVVIVT